MKHEAFYIGVGVGYILEKYGDDFLYGLQCVLAEYRRREEKYRRREEIENARVFDVFGDEIR